MSVVLQLPRRAEALHEPASGAPAEVAGLRPAAGRFHLLGTVLIACGLALLPWVALLATDLPSAAPWVGLDALETLGLVTTGVLLVRGDARHTLTAAATAPLMVIDAWFDITTSDAARLFTASAMAFCAELPLAAVCAVVAVRGFGNRG
ncbi:hypothetical protein AB0A70_35160 [Streptomyces morookaense]|uniref:hypothetical protein n=1 Tax=Streptomyces morookaense TaxID=1970 RepID=UPI0033FDB120